MDQHRLEVKQVELEEKSSSTQLSMPTADDFFLFGVTPTTSGANVSPFTAMRSPAVRAAVLAISEALGQLDVHVYSTGENTSNKATDHPVYPLLHDAVNPWTSASEFREQLTRDALLFGNGYAAIISVDGVPVELSRLAPERMAIWINVETNEPFYVYNPLSGETITYAYSEVLHLRTSSINGIVGESPILQAREAIGLSLVMEAAAGRLFANGARPASSLNLPGVLAPTAVARLKEQAASAHSGTNNGSTIILENGAKFEQLAFTSVDAQFMETRSFQIAEIARAFRVSSVLIGDLDRATFNNASELGRQFINYTLLPWIKRWQGEIALKLFTAADRTAYRVEFDTDDFDRLGLNERAIAYSSLVAAKVYNPNEIRALEGKPSYVGGDEYLNPFTGKTPPTETVTENVRV